MNTGAKKIGGRKSQRKSRKSKKSTRRRAKSRSRSNLSFKTAVLPGRIVNTKARKSRADGSMSLTELQILARSKGIPFGGLSRTKLIKKINNYTY